LKITENGFSTTSIQLDWVLKFETIHAGNFCFSMGWNTNQISLGILNAQHGFFGNVSTFKFDSLILFLIVNGLIAE